MMTNVRSTISPGGRGAVYLNPRQLRKKLVDGFANRLGEPELKLSWKMALGWKLNEVLIIYYVGSISDCSCFS